MNLEINKEIDSLYEELAEYLQKIEMKFLDRIGEEDDLTNWEEEIKAYCLLAHAAIEEYIEIISAKVMSESIDRYLFSGGKNMNNALLGLLAWHGKLKEKIEKESESDDWSKKTFDYLRECMEEIKDKFSQELKANHGVTIKNLRNILLPIALTVKDDPNLKSSLTQLTEGRGSYAHFRIKVKKIFNPKDVRQYVSDCREELCCDMRDKAKRMFQDISSAKENGSTNWFSQFWKNIKKFYGYS